MRAADQRGPGTGNSTLAQMPSARPGLPRGAAESCWVSQRSIPRVGTAITSRGERVVERLGQDRGERVGEGVGPFGAVDVEHDCRG